MKFLLSFLILELLFSLLVNLAEVLASDFFSKEQQFGFHWFSVFLFVISLTSAPTFLISFFLWV